MNSKKLYLLILLLSSLSIYSQESDEWKYLGDKNDGSEVFMKIESSTEYSKEAWIKTVKSFSSKKNKQGKLVKIGGGCTMALWTVNCSSKTYSISHRLEYNSKGSVIDRGLEYNDPTDERVIPETIGEAIFTNICYDNED